MPYHDWFGLMLEGPELPTTAASVVLGGDSAMDVLNLSVYDLDGERGMLMVRQGKGKKDRMVPMGEQAIAWMDRLPEGRAAPSADSAR